MTFIDRAAVVAAGLLGASLAFSADAPVPSSVTTPPTAVPVVGVCQIPYGDVFKSWADYRYDVQTESEAPGGDVKFSGVNIISMDIVIRRADSGNEVAHVPYLGAIGGELHDERPGAAEFMMARARLSSTQRTYFSFPDDQARSLDKNPPGEYLLAVYVNGVRASNVVKVRIDPAYDSAKAPVLQLAGLEPGPRAQYGIVYFIITGPQPPDPILQTRFLSYSFTVDGVARHFDDGAGSGPRGHALASGERKAVFLNGNGWMGYQVFYDGRQRHTFTVSISGNASRGLLGERLDAPATQASHYEAGPFGFDPGIHPLGDAWDAASPPDEKRPVAPTPVASPPASTGIPPPPVTATVLPDTEVMRIVKQTYFSILNFPDLPLSQATIVLGRSIRIKFAIEPNSPGPFPDPMVSLKGSNETLADVLDTICKTTGFTWTVENGTVVFRPPLEMAPSFRRQEN